MNWTEDKKELIKVLLEQGNTIGEISIKTNLTYDQVKHAIRRYDLRKGINIDSGKRERTRFRHQEIVEGVKIYIEEIKDIITNRNDVYRNVPLKVKWDKHKQTEDLALVWSDMHTGMINKHPLTKKITYNESIQEVELQNFLRGVFRFHQLYKPSYNLETFYIFDVGDNITGDRIYEGQLGEITCGVGKQIIKTLNYQSDFIKRVLEVFPRVVIMKVPGNHARTTPKPISEDASNSFEYLLGQLLYERFKDNKRVEVIVPESYTYTARIHNHKYLMTHGNIVRGATLNSIERAVKDIASLAYQEFYNLIIIGHFHTSLKLRITPETNLLVNGCFIEYDDYAYNKLHKFSSATQYLFNISKHDPMHNLQEIGLLWKHRK